MPEPTAPVPREPYYPKNIGETVAAAESAEILAVGKAALQSAKELFDGAFNEGTDVVQLIRARANFIDELLGALWDRHDWADADIALVAVGGYGRGELHPHSDIDILILRGKGSDACIDQVESFLQGLWDLGLDIGHSVRDLAECMAAAASDITVLTNLMEARVIRGNNALMDEVRAGTTTSAMWPSSEFFQAKLQEQQDRHAKYADTEYNLEPNIKGSPGGLRDLQVIGWIAERHYGVESLEALDTEEFLSPDEMQTLSEGRNFMWRVRYALHMISGREEDRLLFDHQRVLAQMWGYEDGDKLAVEQFMQTYYRWALALGQLNEVIIQYFDQAILRGDIEDEVTLINERFEVRNKYLMTRHDNVFENDPSALLEMFVLLGNHPEISTIRASTVRLILDSLHLIDDAFRKNPANHALFLDIIRAPHQMTRQLRRMSRYFVLGTYLPEWGQIVGQMQHDLFHAYTVDAHTLEVIKNMRHFQYPEFEERFPVSSRVARRLPKIELLYIAGLYHDIGKGRGGDHSELGAVDAQRFCEQHGLSKGDTDLVVWLVRSHLMMSAVSQRKDISDPEIITQFAQQVRTQERLDYLFAMTVADINGTNPTLWNAWRGSLLRQLYTETKRALRRGLENPADKQEWVKETLNAATDLLEYRGFTTEELQELWQARGEDYFLRERPEDIAWHTEAIAGHYETEQPLVLIRNTTDSSVANATQIFIHARADAHLFSHICAELEHLDLSIHDARIYNSNDGMSLDTFFVLDSDGNSIAEDGARLTHIRSHLERELANTSENATIVSRRTPRQMKSFTIPTETKMSVDDIKNYSVLEISTPDRPGLLARIGRILVEFDVILQAAKIQTLGERVEDVFFITESDQEPITDVQRCEAIQVAIRRELDQQLAA
ncbi:MAG: [protein-PII] uridylyltransferase [Halioglobus sp.]